MRIFLSGATGVLGRRVVRLLKNDGHYVIGLSRSQKNEDWLNRNEVEARLGDLFNLNGMIKLTSDCDAILHLATAIPKKFRTTLGDWVVNDRIRREGTEILVEAALRNRCRLFLQQSVTFLYGDRHGEWVDEHTHIAEHPEGNLHSAAEMEQNINHAVEHSGLPAIILRFGSFYSHDSAHTQAMLSMIRSRTFAVAGSGEAYWNIIHVDDAALAVSKALNHFSGILGLSLNVCDDEPVLNRELVDEVAHMLGVGRPARIPVFLARLLVGKHTVAFQMASLRCKNQLAKEKLGWSPQYPTYREGYAAVVQQWLEQEARR